MRCLLCALFLVGLPFSALAQPAEHAWEVIYDSQITIRLKDAHFTSGTRHLSWLADEEKSGKKAKNPGPEHLEFREEKSTAYKDGIITYVPLASVQRIEYDHDKKLVSVTIKSAGDKDLVLTGSTKFVGINKFSLDGTADKTAVGVGGALQFQDGLLKAPFRGFAQQGAKGASAPTGRPAVVVAQDKEKTQHAVHGLTALYRVGAGQKLAGVLMFQKVGQIDIGKLAHLRQLPADKKQTASHDYEVTEAGGEKQKLTLLEKTQLNDTQPATLVGLVGRVAAGHKLFPPHTIAEVRFEAAKE
jgi:hypothetical protein